MNKLLTITLLVMAVTSCKMPEARRPISTKSGSFIDASVERNKQLNATEQATIKKLMERDKIDYIASESGFWYYYNNRDTSQTENPEIGDYVEFTYDIKDLNGNSILTDEENGLQRYKIDQSNQDLISGVREGLKLMKEGETVTFLLPSYKAYGYYGIEEKLGTNIPVQSTVTLHSIEHKNGD